METPEFLKNWGWGLAVVFITGVAFPVTVFDYEISAHAALTAAIIDAHNSAFASEKIADEFRFDLIRGSKEEDDDPRWLNHFYDPVRNRGLVVAGVARPSSKQWARDEQAQIYTWRAGIDAYAAGDNHMAFLVLGHILHLLEDASVPEHTRNDLHPVGSPYESFITTRMPVIDGKPPILLADEDAYFDAMALYSNNNFYSADTIDSEDYIKPKPDYIKQEGKYLYGFKTDESGNSYHIVHYIKTSEYTWSVKQYSLLNKEGDKILSDYWRLLSAKAVRYGAGLIHVFLIEAKQARVDHERALKEQGRTRSAASSAVASIIDIFTPGGAQSDAGDESDGLHEVASVSRMPNEKEQPVSSDASQQKPIQAKPKKESARECPFATKDFPAHTPVIFNEIAWMGSKTSANDEWIELKNIGSAAVDVMGWQVVSERDRVRAVFPAGSRILAGGFYLLERTDDKSVPFTSADVIYVGALSNANEGLRLFDKDCRLMDEVIAHPAWPAGNAEGRRTMEAGLSYGQWHDYNGAGTAGIFGTPKAENSIPAPPPAPPIIPPGSGSAGGGSASSPPSGSTGVIGQASASQTVVSVAAEPPPVSGSIVVNEFLFDAEGADQGNEFIELYNPGSKSIVVSSWSVHTATAKKNFEEGMVVGAGQCFLVWLGIPPVGVTPSMQWASGSLNNTSGVISIMAGDSIIDRVSYGKDMLSGFGSGKSWERDQAGSAFHIRDSPSPGNCARLSVGSSVSPMPIVTAIASSSTPLAPVAGVGFLEHVYYYKNPLADNALIDLYWNKYPFVPGGTSDWKIVVFYANSPPGAQASFGTNDGWVPTSTSTLAVQYPTYYIGMAGVRRSVILPDTQKGFGSDGGVSNSAYNYTDLAEDSHARILAPAASPGDYITIGYYALSGSGGGNQQFTLASADPTRYYFDNPKPSFKPPVLSGNLVVSLNREAGQLVIAVPSATDPDSLDRAIAGELVVNGKIVSQRSFFAVPGDALDIQYRARDEFGLYSAPKNLTWQYPGAVEWLIKQEAAGGLSRFIGGKNQNCPLCPDTASFQSISFASDTEANVIVVRLQADTETRASLRLTLYADKAGTPDFSAPLATSTMPYNMITLAAGADAAFMSAPSFVFKKNQPYWLALDVAEYPDSRSYYFPYLRNVVALSGDVYSAGGAAYGTNGACGIYCSFSKDSADWYMKIGMWKE